MLDWLAGTLSGRLVGINLRGECVQIELHADEWGAWCACS